MDRENEFGRAKRCSACLLSDQASPGKAERALFAVRHLRECDGLR